MELLHNFSRAAKPSWTPVRNLKQILAPGTINVLIRNGLYNIAAQIVRGAVSVFTIPLLIRFLGIREFGVWSLASAVQALMIMNEAGISVSTTVFLSKDLNSRDHIGASSTLSFAFVSATVLSVALGLVLWIGGPFIVRLLVAFGVGERSEAGAALQVAGVVVSTLILQRTLVGVEQAFDRYALINILDISQSVLLGAGLVIVAARGGNAVGLMKVQCLISVAMLLTHVLVVWKLVCFVPVRFVWNAVKSRVIFRYSVATWISSLGSAAFSQCDRLIVGAVLGAPLLGIYAAVTGMTGKINSFSGAAVQPLVPSLSRNTANGDPTVTRVRQATQLNSMIAVQSGIVLFVMADVVLRLMLPGVSLSNVTMGLQVTTLIYVLYSFNAVGYFILFAVDEPHSNAIVTTSAAILSLALIWVGGKYVGLVGALAGNAGYLGTLLLVVKSLKKLEVPFSTYAQWIGPSVAVLTVAVPIGLVFREHLIWRVVFVVLQGGGFVFWFGRTYKAISSPMSLVGANRERDVAVAL